MSERRRNQEILRRLREETGLTKSDCREVYDSLFFKILPDMLIEKETISMPGFGLFRLVWYIKGKKVKQPDTKVDLSARIKFEAVKPLKAQMVEGMDV